MEEMNLAVAAGTSDIVKIWMNWMLFIFFAALFFVYWHVSARIILVAIVITIPIAVLIFKQTNNIHLLGISHLICWLPLIIYLIKSEIIGKLEKLKTPYGVYLILLITTVSISLILDIRDIVLVISDIK